MAENSQPNASNVPHRPTTDQATPPPSWFASLAELIQARIALIQAEARQAIAKSVARIAMLVAAIFLAACAWLLIMAAAAGILHIYAGFPWYWACLAIGGAHLLVIIALLRAARTPAAPTFEHTRYEFNKDRQWLHNLQKTKSKD